MDFPQHTNLEDSCSGRESMLPCIVRPNGIRRPVEGEGLVRMIGERGIGGTCGEGDTEEEDLSSKGTVEMVEFRREGLEAEEEDATNGEEMGEYLGVNFSEEEI